MADIATTKSDRESDKLTLKKLEREIISLGGKDVDWSNNSSELAVMIQVLEDIQNQNHSIKTDIYLSECDIRTVHPHSMDVVMKWRYDWGISNGNFKQITCSSVIFSPRL